MTKQELIDLLEDVDDNEEIFVAVQTGDYWRHVAVKPIYDLDQKPVKHSGYLDSLELLDEEDEDSEYVWVMQLG